MAVTSAQISVGTTPTLIHQGDSSCDVYLHSTGITFIGDSTVTTTTGYQMDNGDKLTINAHEQSIYAVVANGTSTLNVLRITK